MRLAIGITHAGQTKKVEEHEETEHYHLLRLAYNLIGKGN